MNKGRDASHWGRFLGDVLLASLGAYGGPETHISVFLDQLAVKGRHIGEREMLGLMALCSILPGPTSTQAIVAVGYKVGGMPLALLTMLVWALPVVLVMTAVSIWYRYAALRGISLAPLRFVAPVAVGFIIVAAWRIGRKVIFDRLTFALLLFSTVMTYAIRAPWIFPVVLLLGGAVALGVAREPAMWTHARFRPPWGYFIVFTLLAVGLLILRAFPVGPLMQLFESFYRYGYLVFGGGQVVVPVMIGELVSVRGYLTTEEFLAGYGLVQGLPGPMFSFAAYTGGMATRDGSLWFQLAGALIGAVGIFLPGLLLIFFVYPIWAQIQSMRAIQIALRGVHAVAGGMILSAALLLLRPAWRDPSFLGICALSAILLLSRRMPAPALVGGAIVMGLLFS